LFMKVDVLVRCRSSILQSWPYV